MVYESKGLGGFEKVYKWVFYIGVSAQGVFMESKLKKIANFFRSAIWFADYGLFLLVNPFKFKKIPKTFKNILVVELLYIGDVIITTPTIRA